MLPAHFLRRLPHGERTRGEGQPTSVEIEKRQKYIKEFNDKTQSQKAIMTHSLLEDSWVVKKTFSLQHPNKGVKKKNWHIVGAILIKLCCSIQKKFFLRKVKNQAHFSNRAQSVLKNASF